MAHPSLPTARRAATLRRKMIYQIGAMIVGLLVVSLSALYGLNGLQADLGAAREGYRELREVYDVGLHVAMARKLISSDQPDTAHATNELDAALAKLDRFLAGPEATRPRAVEAGRLETALRASLRDAISDLRLPPDDAFHPAGNRHAAVDRAISQVAAIGSAIQKTITDRESAARNKWQVTLTVVTVVSSIVVGGAVLLGLFQYRGVISPLRRLGDAARNIAAGHFGDRVEPRGPAEFTELAEDFNRMAGELQSLYRDLEDKVASKGKELARSERLASVGYLAAGVAHEINNPLSVITGYGERALRQIELGEGETMLAAVEKSLRVMCEEAYRCKAITKQLLSLARPGHEHRKPVNLLATAQQVEAAVCGLNEYQDRKLAVKARAGDGGTILATEGEIKQVLLNLVMNGLEAVQPGGEVTVGIEIDGGRAVMTVADNGRGMSAQTLERIFEPFYTEKRGSNRAGTGLGLSITHAIVQSHGGTIRASSEGPGRGSRFVLEFPLASDGVAT